MRPLFTLFWSFFKIGLFTFGGGYAMIPLIRREVIDRRNWIAERDFLDLLTLAQSAPGPISLNTSVFVGYKMRGYAGAAMHPALYAVIALTAAAVRYLSWSPVWILIGAAAAGMLHALYRLPKKEAPTNKKCGTDETERPSRKEGDR